MTIVDFLVKKPAQRIADMYIQRFPREKEYGITLTSTEDDSEDIFYYQMSERELGILRKWENLKDEDREEYMDLGDFLEAEGAQDLINKYLSHNSPFQLNIIKDCDTEKPLCFTRFRVRQVNLDDNTLDRPCHINVPLSDDEYKQLFALALVRDNELTMNMIVNELPELAQKITRHISWALLDFVIETKHPFIFEPIEIHEAITPILDSKQDLLGLFKSEDEKLRIFAENHKPEI